jgi:hypothetical protein
MHNIIKHTLALDKWYLSVDLSCIYYRLFREHTSCEALQEPPPKRQAKRYPLKIPVLMSHNVQ